MGYNLYLDDIRTPPREGWVIARDFEEAVAIVESRGLPDFISFDHDLGEGLTGYDFAKWLVELAMRTKSTISFFVHSANPVGAKNIQAYIDNYNSFIV